MNSVHMLDHITAKLRDYPDIQKILECSPRGSVLISRISENIRSWDGDVLDVVIAYNHIVIVDLMDVHKIPIKELIPDYQYKGDWA